MSLSAISPKSTTQVYNGFLDCLKKTYSKEGLRPFYRGLGPLSMKLGPHTVLCLMFWEQMKEFYDNCENTYDKYNPDLNLYNKHFVQNVIHDNSCELYW